MNASDNKEPNFICAADLMPKSPEAQRILQQRAQALATSQIVRAEAQGIKYISFDLGAAHEHYGIAYNYAREVMNNVTITKIPNTPAHIAGVINRRGALIAVVDLKQFFHTQVSSYTKDSYVIIINAKDTTIGILADDIKGSDMYEPSQLDPPFSFLNLIKPEYIAGLHRGVTAIINVDALLAAPELKVQNN